MPLSIILMDTAFAFGGVLALRVLRRALYERYETARGAATNGGSRRKPGAARRRRAGRAAGGAGDPRRGDNGLDVRGFVDDEPVKLDSVIQGVKVLGTTRDLPRLVKELDIDQVIITIAEAPRQESRRIVELCESIPVRVRIIPGLFEILQGKVEVNRIRDVAIEDLLGREPVQLDAGALGAFLTGRRVMVTGAGGSIGSELVRQIARYRPTALLLVERAENALFDDRPRDARARAAA